LLLNCKTYIAKKKKKISNKQRREFFSNKVQDRSKLNLLIDVLYYWRYCIYNYNINKQVLLIIMQKNNAFNNFDY